MWQNFHAQPILPRSMRAFAISFVPLFLPLAVFGQFVVGVSAGAFRQKLIGRADDASHDFTDVDQVVSPVFTASAFYRERYCANVDLGLELTFVHRSFSAYYGSYGLAGTRFRSVHAELDQLYLCITPEVHLNASGNSVVRFGVMSGVRIGGSAEGESYSSGVIGNDRHAINATNDFGGDLRLVFGFGFRLPLGDRWSVSLDPYSNTAITSMLKSASGIRGTDVGLRIGLGRRFFGKPVTKWLAANTPDLPPGPNW